MDDFDPLAGSAASAAAAAAMRAAQEAQGSNAAANMRMDVLENFLAYVGVKLLLGEPLDVKDEPVHAFFRIPKDHSDPAGVLRARLASLRHEKPATVKCPDCGSAVAIENDVCGFCGAKRPR